MSHKKTLFRYCNYYSIIGTGSFASGVPGFEPYETNLFESFGGLCANRKYEQPISWNTPGIFLFSSELVLEVEKERTRKSESDMRVCLASR